MIRNPSQRPTPAPVIPVPGHAHSKTDPAAEIRRILLGVGLPPATYTRIADLLRDLSGAGSDPVELRKELDAARAEIAARDAEILRLRAVDPQAVG